MFPINYSQNLSQPDPVSEPIYTCPLCPGVRMEPIHATSNKLECVDCGYQMTISDIIDDDDIEPNSYND